MPNTNRVLIVEDHQDTLKSLFIILTDAGYSVLTAENGAQAVDLLGHGLHPRLILLDLMLPRVSGWEVLKFLREDPGLREVPVVVLTARDAVDAHAVAVDAVLTKPIESATLLETIERVLGSASISR